MHSYIHAYIYTCINYIDINAFLPTYIHTYLDTYLDANMHAYTNLCLVTCMCHTGVFSGTIKCLVCALGANSSMKEPTINLTLYAFIEQVNFYDLQKMVLLFAICFVPTMVYTYMVYTLYN